jgi:hypothetical protein
MDHSDIRTPLPQMTVIAFVMQPNHEDAVQYSMATKAAVKA